MGLSEVLNIGNRAIQFVWALLIMALTGNMIAQAVGGNPSVVNYAIFTSVFAMLSLFYLIPATISSGFAGHPLILIGVDTINMFFFFTCGIALAAELNVHSCSNQGYIDTNRITNGTTPGNRGKRCREAQAVTAFEWFAFASFAISAVLSFMSSRSSGGISGPRRGGPSMRQV